MDLWLIMIHQLAFCSWRKSKKETDKNAVRYLFLQRFYQYSEYLWMWWSIWYSEEGVEIWPQLPRENDATERRFSQFSKQNIWMFTDSINISLLWSPCLGQKKCSFTHVPWRKESMKRPICNRFFFTVFCVLAKKIADLMMSNVPEST